MSAVYSQTITEKIPLLGGGPLGLGDPNDRRLRKTERDLIIPKMVREEATKRCSKTLKLFLDCAKEAGLSMVYKCSAETDENNKCLSQWLNNPELVNEMTDKYLSLRSHYRRTGQPSEKYDRIKKRSGSGFC